MSLHTQGSTTQKNASSPIRTRNPSVLTVRILHLASCGQCDQSLRNSTQMVANQ